jgi:hypothetical protein
MKTTSLSVIALVAALAMAAPTLSYAQASGAVDATTEAAGAASGAASGSSDAVDASAGGDAAAGATGGANASTDGSSTDVSTGATLTLDANADGTISVDEIAAADAAIGTGVSIDVDGDGTISDDEAAAANTALAALGSQTLSCADSGLEATIAGMGQPDMDALNMAASVSVVVVSDCDAAEVTSALASEGATGIRAALEANANAVAAIQARGATLADVLGATTSGDTVTVYVATAAS